MPLTDAKIRALAPGDKLIKVADEKGLFLLVSPAGGRSWRLKCRIGGKEGQLGLGRYPDVSLKEARRRRDEAMQKLANGIDPGGEKKAAKAAVVLAAGWPALGQAEGPAWRRTRLHQARAGRITQTRRSLGKSCRWRSVSSRQ